MKGMKRFGVKRKLGARYIRPFPILKKCMMVAYKLDLDVLQLKKCLKAPMDVVLPKVALLEADLSYPSTQSRSWIRKIVSQGIKQSSSSRLNGATTLGKKQCGKVRTSFILAIQTSFCHSEEMSDCSLFL
jgi:hypothetical protein